MGERYWVEAAGARRIAPANGGVSGTRWFGAMVLELGLGAMLLGGEADLRLG